MVSDKPIHIAFRIHKTLYTQTPLENILIFTFTKTIVYNTLALKGEVQSRFKVDLRRYFTLIIFREIAQRVHANPSNDNFRPHGKH